MVRALSICLCRAVLFRGIFERSFASLGARERPLIHARCCVCSFFFGICDDFTLRAAFHAFNSVRFLGIRTSKLGAFDFFELACKISSVKASVIKRTKSYQEGDSRVLKTSKEGLCCSVWAPPGGRLGRVTHYLLACASRAFYSPGLFCSLLAPFAVPFFSANMCPTKVGACACFH